MIFEATPLAGLMVVRAEKRVDARGFFARVWCEEEFRAAGVGFVPRQVSVSFNQAAGTLRGMHWQAAPFGETKLVRATAGRVWDVVVDVREGSATRLGWFGLELDAREHVGILIPPGFAHGFLTLSEGAELQYMIDTPYAPEAARGARFDDPAVGIVWPGVPVVMAERDLGFPALV
jgi:dTDP-4-dehydrorhamnose 3,5-epimerase